MALALLEELNEPLLTTTLQMPGDEFPLTEGWEIQDRLEDQIELILDAGHCGTDAHQCYRSDRFGPCVNFIDYHFTFASTNVAAYTLMVNKNKTGDEKIILKKADDGNYYLQPGKFTLVFTGPKNENIIKEFEIKARERKSRSQQ